MVRCERVLAVGSAGRARGLLLAFVAATLCFPALAPAQSGRRPKRPAPNPPPVVAGGPEVVKLPSETPVLVRSVVVAGTLVHDYAGYWSSEPGRVYKGCAKRLEELKVPEVQNAGKMARIEAINRTREGSGVYVVWLEVRIPRRSAKHVNYYVFQPPTGKLFLRGRVYYGERSSASPKIVGLPPGAGTSDDWFEEAGRVVAERIRNHLQH
jgi:hypothetical protein